MNLYTYVIATDAGSAPNYDPPFVTLAICKPRIRMAAEIGDVILAFAGARLGSEPHAVVWAGVVAEKIPFPRYWEDHRFAGKKPDHTPTPDNIYRPTPDGIDVRQVPNPVHDTRNAATDLRGRFAIVCAPSWRFGSSRAVLPADFGYRMPITARRGHRVHSLPADSWRVLRSWLDRQPQIQSHKPPSSRKSCRPSKSQSNPLRSKKSIC